jgi:small-conductance mechanosensitive channel
MMSWPALLLAPLIALVELSIAYALVSPACASQDRSSLHAVAVVSLLVVLVMTALAWRDRRGHAAAPRGAARERGSPRDVTRADSDAADERPHFVAQMAVVVGALSALVCVALWVPVWFLSPCY